MFRLIKTVVKVFCYSAGLTVVAVFASAFLLGPTKDAPTQTATSASVAVAKAEPVRQVSAPATPSKEKELSDLDKTVLHASALCKAVDKSGIATTPCEISGWNSTITVTMVADDSTANEFCDTATSFVRKGGYHFNAGWELHVVSPYSNGTPIARCSL